MKYAELIGNLIEILITWLDRMTESWSLMYVLTIPILTPKHVIPRKAKRTKIDSLKIIVQAGNSFRKET